MIDQARGFDFLVGRWSVRHRRLAARLANSHDWVEFDGTADCRPLLAGHANVDDNILELPAGRYRAVTLRAFDPKSDLWSIWWLDGREPHHLDTPMLGSFRDRTGTFYADDVFEGRAIRVRFLWSEIGPRSCRWEQAFSADAGTTWEANWVMQFTRVE